MALAEALLGRGLLNYSPALFRDPYIQTIYSFCRRDCLSCHTSAISAFVWFVVVHLDNAFVTGTTIFAFEIVERHRCPLIENIFDRAVVDKYAWLVFEFTFEISYVPVTFKGEVSSG
jgi:hypothetical protein